MTTATRSSRTDRASLTREAILTAAERLGIAPKHCLVFEDAEMGIESARAAGMAYVRVPLPCERRGGTNNSSQA